MTVLSAHGFDRLAPSYRDLWTDSKAGRLQRDAVWSRTADLFPAGSRILDLGCGTGDDAVMFLRRGIHVTGIDASAEMIRIARSRGVDARTGAIEDAGEFPEPFDAVWSNFGVLNCIGRLADLGEPFARLVRPGGWLVACLMTRVCLWETIWYAIHGNAGKAVRRWSGSTASSVTPLVFYPTARAVRRAFAPEFRLIAAYGIGVAVPPSYVTGISGAAMDRLAALDRRLAALPILRSIGDHRLLIFRKEQK